MHDLVKQVANVFMDRYHSIMGGVEVVGGLIEHVPSKRELDCVKKLTVEFCYQEKSVERLEIMGSEVLGGFLNTLIPAVHRLWQAEQDPGKRNSDLVKQAEKLVRLLGKRSSLEGLDLYQRFLRVTDFVSGMTDSYAVRNYRQLRGFDISVIE